jgi:hypothetical protein
MKDNLRTLLGLLDDGKRVYRFEDGEVDREEFQYSQIMFNYLFDDENGVIATLGPTWNMIHDPRFNKIENCFIRRRKNIFSEGETVLGQQIVTGAFAGFSTDVSQLDQYSTILGEGRHFRKILLEGGIKDEDGDTCHPKTFYQESDAIIWGFIKRECPNYFTREGAPNREATNLYNLIKEDLLGLIDDYAEVPFVDEFINSESGDVFEPSTWDGETPVIYVEIDLLEKALTVRGSLRVTAARILDRLGFSEHISGGERLTSAETDELLRIVYTSKWPDDRLALVTQIMFFIQTKNAIPFEQREREQLALASERSHEFIAKIKSGDVKQINRETDAPKEVSMDPEAAVIKSIQDNPYKRDLFMMLTDAENSAAMIIRHRENAIVTAEERGEQVDPAILEPSVEEKIATLLLPVFENADYFIDEQVFRNFVTKVRDIRQGKSYHPTQTVAGQCEAEVEPYWNSEVGAMSKICRKPLPCPIHG